MYGMITAVLRTNPLLAHSFLVHGMISNLKFLGCITLCFLK